MSLCPSHQTLYCNNCIPIVYSQNTTVLLLPYFSLSSYAIFVFPFLSLTNIFILNKCILPYLYPNLLRIMTYFPTSRT